MAGTAISGAFGQSGQRGLTGLDEVGATLEQPRGPATDSDINVIRQMAGASDSPIYRKILEFMIRNR